MPRPRSNARLEPPRALRASPPASRPTARFADPVFRRLPHHETALRTARSFIRRQETQSRVIGTLLGSVNPDGSVDVRNSYAVPHNEQNGQVFVDVEFHRAMCGSNQQHDRAHRSLSAALLGSAENHRAVCGSERGPAAAGRGKPARRAARTRPGAARAQPRRTGRKAPTRRSGAPRSRAGP